MKKLILGAILLFTTLSFGQSKKSNPPVTIKHSQFDKATTYIGNAGALGVYAIKNDGEISMSYDVLTITVFDSYLTYGKDLILLFSNGETLSLSTNEELGDYNRTNKLLEYYVFAHPTNKEWYYISTHKIVGFKFHIFERKYNNSDSLNFLINKILNIDELKESIISENVKENEDSSVHSLAGIEQKPEFIGGIENFYSFVSKNYQNPKEGLKGKIYVTFIVEKDGLLTNIKVIRDVGYGTGEEAIRVLKLCPKWVAGEQNGEKVRVLYSLPITI